MKQTQWWFCEREAGVGVWSILLKCTTNVLQMWSVEFSTKDLFDSWYLDFHLDLCGELSDSRETGYLQHWKAGTVVWSVDVVVWQLWGHVAIDRGPKQSISPRSAISQSHGVSPTQMFGPPPTTTYTFNCITYDLGNNAIYPGHFLCPAVGHILKAPIQT